MKKFVNSEKVLKETDERRPKRTWDKRETNRLRENESLVFYTHKNNFSRGNLQRNLETYA